MFEFSGFTLDVEKKILRQNGSVVNLAPKALDVLCLLAARPGEIITKEEIFETVWHDAFVEEGNLTHQIYELRKLFKSAGCEPIETVPRRGYIFHPDQVSEENTETLQALTNDFPAPEITPKRNKARLIIAAAALLAAVILSFGVWRAVSNEKTDTAKIGSIAVLPFVVTNSSDPEKKLSLKITDSIITRLGEVRSLSVRPTSAVMKFDGSEPFVAAEQLGVDAVMTGSIQQEGEKLRVNVQLYSIADKAQIWTRQFDGDSARLLSLQDAISGEAIAHLNFAPSGERKAALGNDITTVPEAYEAYLRGRYLLNLRSSANLQKSIEEFENAVRHDPNFAHAYAGLGDAWALLSVYDARPPIEAFPRAKEFSERALAIDKDLAEAHATLGFIAYRFDWDWEKAETELRRAIALKPNYATAHHWLGEMQNAQGDFDEGERSLKRALALDPTSLVINTDLGYGYFLSGRSELAVEQLENTARLNPNFSLAYYCLSDAYAQQDYWEKATDSFALWLEKADFERKDAEQFKNEFARGGKNAFLRAQVVWMDRQMNSGYFTKFDLARVYASLGENNKALQWLESCLDDHSADLIFVKVHPSFAQLRSDTRFQAVLQKLGLQQ